MRVLIIPQYSMRSYETGTYSLLADGNLNLVLHQIFSDTRTNEYVITYPEDHVPEELVVLKEKILVHFNCKVTIRPIPYGKHAMDNRTIVPKFFEGANYDGYAYVITFFENLRPTIPWILKMSMSKIQELARPYADKFYSDFLNALKEPLLIRADVLNYSQLKMVQFTSPALTKKVNVNEKCLNKKLYSILSNTFVKNNIVHELNTLVPKDAIFFPFRLSDKAYDFERAKLLGRPIVVTDPNESLDDPNIIKISGNMKELLFSMMELMTFRKDIKIPLYENCELAVHQLIIELAYMVPDALIDINTDEIVERYTF